MKTVHFVILAIPFLLNICSKSDTPAPPPTPVVTDASIAFSVNVDPGAGNILGVVGTSQAIIAKISSVVPTAGVTISVVVTKDADNSNVFSSNTSSTTADNTITITGLSSGALCTALVTVTSKSTLTNTKAVSFKLAAK